jgi:hypothetical protein
MKSRDNLLLKVLSSGRYTVTRAGLVIDQSSGLVRIPSLDADGHKVLNLSECGNVRISRLVALKYLGRGNGRQVAHLNRNNQDDCASNLQWLTPKETSELAHQRGLVPHPVGKALPSTKLTPEKVREIKRRLDAGGKSQRELGAEFGVTKGAIQGIKYGKSWMHLEVDSG